MNKVNENIIIASNASGTFAYRSFSRFCKTVGLQRRKFRTIPEQVETPFGIFDIQKLPMNVSMECHRLRNFMCEKFKVVSKGNVHQLIGKSGDLYNIHTDDFKTHISWCHFFQQPIELDDSTAEFILSKLKESGGKQ